MTGSAPTSLCMRSITLRPLLTGRSAPRKFSGTGMGGCRPIQRRLRLKTTRVRNWCGFCWNRSLARCPMAPHRGGLNWESYRWAMSSVWLENVLTRQPARWLPAGYSDYGSLLTAALENVVKTTRLAVDHPAKASGAPSDLAQWKWGENYQVEIDHLVLSHLPLIGRFTGPGRHPLSGSNFTVKAVDPRLRTFGTGDVELCQPRRKHAEPGDGRERNIFKSLLHGSVDSVVRRLDVCPSVFGGGSGAQASARDDVGAAVESARWQRHQCAARDQRRTRKSSLKNRA